MHSAYREARHDPVRASSRQRAIVLALAILAHLLLIVILLRMTVAPSHLNETERRLLAFQLSPEVQPARTQTPRPRVVREQQVAARAPSRPPPPPTQVKTQSPVPMTDLMPMDLASSDISKMPSHSRAGEDEQADASGNGADSKAAYGPGEGPGGVRLYDPEWYRRPTHAELANYLSAEAPHEGWGEIACRTIPDFRVDDCQFVGEQPLGSGFARSARLAAWQFRIRPPRIGGKAQVGAWVRIRIIWTPGGLTADGAGG